MREDFTIHKMAKAPCCEGCTNWDEFKENCWVFWERKKICSQHSDNDM